jgi:hypothetical protein
MIQGEFQYEDFTLSYTPFERAIMRKKSTLLIIVLAIIWIANFAISDDAGKPSKYKSCMDQCKAEGKSFPSCNPKCSVK